MPLLPPTLSFPEPDTFVKYWDQDLRGYRYLHLVERDLPLKYPQRIASLAPGAVSPLTIFEELDPSEDKHHVYKFYLGCYPEFLYYLWHPYDVKQLSLDSRVTAINTNLTATIAYEESPHDAPTKSVWIVHERYPGLEVRNVGRQIHTAKVFWLGAKYRVEYDEEISAETKNQLTEGTIPALPISVGGEY